MRRARGVLPLIVACLSLQSCIAVHLARTAIHDRNTLTAPAPGTADDASHLNATRVSEIVDVSPDDAVAIPQIQSALQRARAAHAGVSIAGFRHSMGGHTIAANGIVLNMLPHARMQLLDDGTTLRVQAGAVWSDVIRYLDPRGRSVEVMQSDSPFSVGGSLSVNCHGWQHLHQPIASTVLAMTVMKPDGTVTRCSRTENSSLFSHILGGYGLFGVILDADLRTVPNDRYRATHTTCDIRDYEATFDRLAPRAESGMVYGRLSVAPESFLREAILTVYEHEDGPIPPIRGERGAGFARLVFRGSAGSDYGKSLRWRLEKSLGPRLETAAVSRNELLSHRIENYINRSGDGTDILHEYFVPRGRLAVAVERIRNVLQQRAVDLLNVTLRDVRRDETTALPYARQDMIAIVMYFHQKKTPAAEQAMEEATRQLISIALDTGGTYYLPYRLHATPEQFRRAYPNAAAFFAEKCRLDPDELFTNQWYRRYGGCTGH